MNQEYADYLSIAAILLQVGLGLLDVISDIEYVVNAKKFSDEILWASLFFVIFQPFC